MCPYFLNRHDICPARMQRHRRAKCNLLLTTKTSLNTKFTIINQLCGVLMQLSSPQRQGLRCKNMKRRRPPSQPVSCRARRARLSQQALKTEAVFSLLHLTKRRRHLLEFPQLEGMPPLKCAAFPPATATGSTTTTSKPVFLQRFQIVSLESCPLHIPVQWRRSQSPVRYLTYPTQSTVSPFVCF